MNTDFFGTLDNTVTYTAEFNEMQRVLITKALKYYVEHDIIDLADAEELEVINQILTNKQVLEDAVKNKEVIGLCW